MEFGFDDAVFFSLFGVFIATVVFTLTWAWRGRTARGAPVASLDRDRVERLADELRALATEVAELAEPTTRKEHAGAA